MFTQPTPLLTRAAELEGRLAGNAGESRESRGVVAAEGLPHQSWIGMAPNKNASKRLMQAPHPARLMPRRDRSRKVPQRFCEPSIEEFFLPYDLYLHIHFLLKSVNNMGRR